MAAESANYVKDAMRDFHENYHGQIVVKSSDERVNV